MTLNEKWTQTHSEICKLRNEHQAKVFVSEKVLSIDHGRLLGTPFAGSLQDA